MTNVNFPPPPPPTLEFFLQEELNRTWNREICKNFDEMAGKLGDIPDQTKVKNDKSFRPRKGKPTFSA